jgi:NADPH2:quinone reductase
MSSGSNTIRAARVLQHDAPLVVHDVSLLQPGPDEVRVELAFGGVNPVDRYIASGLVYPEGRLPRTLGGEAGGWVDGRPVLVAGEGLGTVRDGVWAQAAVVPRVSVVDLPDGVQPRQAAAMGIAGLTALNCVRHVAKVTASDRVIALGASGGVGSMVVSLCAAAGATVWGQTGSQAKAAGILEEGAAHVVVGDAAQIAAELDEFQPTVAFDALGGAFMSTLVDAVAPHGRIVSFGVSAGAEVAFNMQHLYRKAVALLGYGGMQLTREQRLPGLREALAAVAAGDLKVRIDDVLPLEQVNDAFQRLIDRQVRGNLLLDLS